MFTYAKRSTIVPSKIHTVQLVPQTRPGHSRSIPKVTETPAPSKRYKTGKAIEKPVGIGASGFDGAPATEPEYPTSPEPMSRL